MKSKNKRLLDNSIIAKNKNLYLYRIIKTYIAGIELKGTEVKAIIESAIDINNAFVVFLNNEAYLLNSAIAWWKNAAHNNHDIRRKRKLLLKKSEIHYIRNYSKERGCTIIPTKLIRKNRKFKVEIAIVKRLKLFDKREVLKKKAIAREKKKELIY